jgi:hypothetical protein
MFQVRPLVRWVGMVEMAEAVVEVDASLLAAWVVWG